MSKAHQISSCVPKKILQWNKKFFKNFEQIIVFKPRYFKNYFAFHHLMRLLWVISLAWIADKIRVSMTWWIESATLISKNLEKINLTFEEGEKMSRNNYFYSISLVRSLLSLTWSGNVGYTSCYLLEFPFIKWDIINNNQLHVKLFPPPRTTPSSPGPQLSCFSEAFLGLNHFTASHPQSFIFIYVSGTTGKGHY